MDAPITAPLYSRLRFKAFGARHLSSQLPRIEDGFRALGAMEGDEQPGNLPYFVYANDSERWEEAANWRDAHAPSAKLVLTCLDVPEWNLPSGYNPYEKLDILKRADAICAISRYVQSQIHRYYALPSYLIYQPIMDVTADARVAGKRPYPQFKAMMVGRLRDPSKRAELAVNALVMAGFSETEVAVVGSEPLGWGTYMGSVSPEMLSDLYNSVDYVLCASAAGGLELPPLEGIVCGAIPIVCSDLTTFHEGFYPAYWGCYPNAHSVAYRLRLLESNPDLKAREQAYCLERAEVLRDYLGKTAVARRILDVVGKLSKET